MGMARVTEEEKSRQRKPAAESRDAQRWNGGLRGVSAKRGEKWRSVVTQADVVYSRRVESGSDVMWSGRGTDPRSGVKLDMSPVYVYLGARRGE